MRIEKEDFLTSTGVVGAVGLEKFLAGLCVIAPCGSSVLVMGLRPDEGGVDYGSVITSQRGVDTLMFAGNTDALPRHLFLINVRLRDTP